MKASFKNLCAEGQSLFKKVCAWVEAQIVVGDRKSTMFLDQMKPSVIGSTAVYRPFDGQVQIIVNQATKRVYAQYAATHVDMYVENSSDLFGIETAWAVHKMNLLPSAFIETTLEDKARNRVFHMAVGYKLGRSPKVMGNIASKWFFKNVLDQRITAILYRVLGFRWSLKDYSHVWQHLPAVEEAMRIAPGCVTPWLLLMRENVFGRNAFYRLDDEPQPEPAGPIPDVLRWIGSEGLTRTAWKWMISSKPRTFMCAYLLRSKPVAILSDPGVKLPASTIYKLFTRNGWDHESEQPRPYEIALFRALSREVPKRGLKLWAHARLNELGLIKDAFAEPYEGGYPALEYDHARMRNWSWDSFMRAQREWHQGQQGWRNAAYDAQRQARRAITWDSKHAVLEKDGFEAVALTTGGALDDEGKAMHHCVEGYVEQCVRGTSRIFSIRKDGKQLSTLEIKPEYAVAADVDGDPIVEGWVVAQHRGVCNAAVKGEEAKFGKWVASQYRK